MVVTIGERDGVRGQYRGRRVRGTNYEVSNKLQSCVKIVKILIMLNWFMMLFRCTISFTFLYIHSINIFERLILKLQLKIVIYLLKNNCNI